MRKTKANKKPGTGGRPETEAHLRLSAKLQGRVTIAEKADFIAKADAANMSEGELIRALANNLEVRSPHRGKDPELVQAVRALQRELNSIGNNVNQIALAANRYGDIPYYWREVGDQLRKTLDSVLEITDP